MHPTLLVRVRVTLAKSFYFLFGNLVTYNRIDVHPGSRLEHDMAPGSPTSRFFGPLGPHIVDVFEYGLVYDTRDDETDTRAGAYHQLKVRLSPGGIGLLPYRYGQASAVARFYATPIRRWLTLGLRVVGDAQFGDPPFYELARYEDTFAFGGGNGVRGIPGQRYYGKLKVFGNFEVRSELVTFSVSAKEYALGWVAFFDAGRLWADGQAPSSLDGSGSGLKYGAGGGLRFRQGKSFVVRADVAWSPDARPLGAYVTAGHAF
jgi:outer membrane protein assembly factor BamA